MNIGTPWYVFESIRHEKDRLQIENEQLKSFKEAFEKHLLSHGVEDQHFLLDEYMKIFKETPKTIYDGGN